MLPEEEDEVEVEREEVFGVAPRRLPLGALAFRFFPESESLPARAAR